MLLCLEKQFFVTIECDFSWLSTHHTIIIKDIKSCYTLLVAKLLLYWIIWKNLMIEGILTSGAGN